MQAEILSVQSITDLEAAVGTFASRAVDALAAIRADLLGRRATLNVREERASLDIRNSLEALEYADEDEREFQLRVLFEARERLSRVRDWQRRVDTEYQRFLVQAASVDQRLEVAIPHCRKFLRTRCEELRGYLSIEPDPVQSGSSSGRHVAHSPPLRADEASPHSPAKLTEHRLPDGFKWIPLEEINPAELADVASRESFKKVPYTTMSTGLRRLAEEILPRVNENPVEVDSDFFEHLDAAAGESYESGLKRVYEAFFCRDEVVYLERRQGQETFDIINGRHRIRVALDLGWAAIPARAKDLKG